MELQAHQRYLIEEFAEDYQQKRMGRRELLRRVLLITGSVAATATVLTALGCGDDDDDAAATATGAAGTTTAAATAAGATPPSSTTSGVTVQPTDPAIEVRDVRYPGEATEVIGYLARPRATGTYPAVVVIHENRGLLEHFKDVARRYAREGFVALAVDLLSRRGGTTPENASALGQIGEADLTADLVSSVDYLKQQQFVRATAIGASGFCFGGNFTWNLAIADADVRAAVPYYGTVDLDRLAQIQGAVLAIYGGDDARVTSQAPQVEERLRAAGKTFQVKVYPGANHAFFNDTGQRYHAEASRDAWQQTIGWFRQHLRA